MDARPSSRILRFLTSWLDLFVRLLAIVIILAGLMVAYKAWRDGFSSAVDPAFLKRLIEMTIVCFVAMVPVSLLQLALYPDLRR